jgi:hypothetical protein
MSDFDTEVYNRNISAELLKLMSTFGNLQVHVSGEAKVDFRRALGQSNAWVGMTSTIVSGDVGCLRPYESYPTCALDSALDFLYNLDCAPHLNSSINEEHVPDSVQWKEFVDGIEKEMKNLVDTHYKKQYTFELKLEGSDIPVIVVTLKPLCNEFVAGEFIAANKYTFLGQIDDFDQPKVKSCFVVANGKEYEVELEKLIYFRNKIYWAPEKGDYLVKDEESGMYVVLPKEDYSIH